MTSRDFCFWLQGYMELSEASSAAGTGFSHSQREKIAAHLKLVFVHEIDPSMGDADNQAKLNAVHGSDPAWKRPGPGDITSPNVVLRC
jgi:hypothetical protein